MGVLLQFPANRKEISSLGVESTEIIIQARYLFEAIGDEGLKLTSRGNLPSDFTLQFWQKFVEAYDPEYRPNREIDCIELYRLNFLLSEARYVRRREGRIHLTKKARDFDPGELYKDLITAMMFEYNWAFDDQFEEHPEFQRMALDFLAWIVKGGAEPLSPLDLYDAHFESYLSRKTEIKDDRLREIAEEPVFCLQTRFFDRFCVPFGLTGPGDADGLYQPTKLLLERFFPQIGDRL